MDRSDGSVELVQSQYDWSTSRPSLAVITAIAALENADPIDLPVTLCDHINPDALDALVDNENPITVSFTFDAYHIEIDQNRLVITDE